MEGGRLKVKLEVVGRWKVKVVDRRSTPVSLRDGRGVAYCRGDRSLPWKRALHLPRNERRTRSMEQRPFSESRSSEINRGLGHSS